MQKLISELTRLYLPEGSLSPALLEQRLTGAASLGVNLATADGLTRTMLIAFPKMAGSEDAHWTDLCTVANAMQVQLGLPAPAVSISGTDSFGLWLSLAEPLSTARIQQFLDLLCDAYFPRVDGRPDAGGAPVALPPCLHQDSGKWAAFIHPGLGASFCDEAGLEMAPPSAGQAALLESLQSITADQFLRAMNLLQVSDSAPAERAAPGSQPVVAPALPGLLLSDASLEDIVRHLHEKNIEPTFRHVIRS